MLRFATFEALGVEAAALSDRGDGGCGWGVGETVARTACVRDCGGDAAALVAPAQVHGARVLPVSGAHRGRGAETRDGAPEADALISNTPGLPLGISVADCVPVFLFDPVKRAGGVIHAGRAGTQAGITAKALRLLGETYGVQPQDVHALIGPSAGLCCYEVSEELAGAFRAAGYPTRGRNLDLWAGNRLQLEAAGVPAERIEITGYCTICGDRFFSYRRGDKTARNLALLIL